MARLKLYGGLLALSGGALLYLLLQIAPLDASLCIPVVMMIILGVALLVPRSHLPFLQPQKPGVPSLKFELVAEQPPPGCLLMMVQTLLVAPIATLLVWFVVGLAAHVLFLDRLLAAITSPLGDLSRDVDGVIALFLGGLLAGFLTVKFIPNFESTGRWLWLPGLLFFPLLQPQFFEFQKYADHRSMFSLTLIEWFCDPDAYLAYLCVAYSAGALLATRQYRPTGFSHN